MDKSKWASCVKYLSSVSRPPLKDSSKVNSHAEPVHGLTLIEGSSKVCWQIKHLLFASSIYLHMYTIILISTFLVSSSMVEELATASNPVISSLLRISSAAWKSLLVFWSAFLAYLASKPMSTNCATSESSTLRFLPPNNFYQMPEDYFLSSFGIDYG